MINMCFVIINPGYYLVFSHISVFRMFLKVVFEKSPHKIQHSHAEKKKKNNTQSSPVKKLLISKLFFCYAHLFILNL